MPDPISIAANAILNDKPETPRQPVVNVADLPTGSVVATADQVWMKHAESLWSDTGSWDNPVRDFEIDDKVRAGAQVLRVGDGTS